MSEELIQEQTEKEVPTFEILVKTEIKKFDEVVPAIEELKKQFLPLKIQSLDDKEGYENVSKALRFIISKRTAVEDKRKELKADSLAFGRAVDSRAKEITEMLTPIEEHLKFQKQKIDNEKKRIEEEKQLALQKRLFERHQKLMSAGMQLIGETYVYDNALTLEQTTLHRLNLETFSDEEFNEFADKVAETAKKVNEQIEAEQKRRDEEAAELLRKQQEMDKERENFLEERLQQRLEKLESLFENDKDKFKYIGDYITYDGNTLLLRSEVKNSSKELWDELYAEVKSKKEKIDADIQKEIERIRKEEEDKAQRKVAEAERMKKEQAEREAEQQKQLLENATDKEKVADYCRRLLEVATPELKTAKWKKVLTDLQFEIKNIA